MARNTPSFTSIGSYVKNNKLQLQISSLVKELIKTAKTRLVWAVKYSPDKLICDAGIVTHTGKKWSAKESVNRQRANSGIKTL